MTTIDPTFISAGPGSTPSKMVDHCDSVVQSERMNSASQSDTDRSDPHDAATQLTLIVETNRRSRLLAGAVWFPLLVGGIVTLAAPSVIDMIGGPAAPAWYWAVAGPAIGVACAVFYATRRVQLPATTASISVVTAAVMVIGALALGILVSGAARTAAPFLIVGSGFVVFAWIYRSALVLVVALANIIAAIVLFLVDTARIEQLVYVVCGLVACAAAVVAVMRLTGSAGSSSDLACGDQ